MAPLQNHIPTHLNIPHLLLYTGKLYVRETLKFHIMLDYCVICKLCLLTKNIATYIETLYEYVNYF